MNVAFDIDDTITRTPEFFAFLSHALQSAGHRVIIITFRDNREATADDLRAWGVAYDELITSTLDLCLEHGVDEWKAEVCRKHCVNILFEDDPDVLRHVDDSVICMMPVDKSYHVLEVIRSV